MSTISASTTSTTAYKVTADTTGTLVLQTGATPTTAVTIGTDQSVTTAGTINGLTIGKGAGAVSTNTAVGASALAANTTGSYLVAVGYSAGSGITTSNNTIAIGGGSMAATMTGAQNIGIGRAALAANTSGADNTAAGHAVMQSNTTGASNTAFGSQALQANTTASNNTAVGYQAGYANTTGASNAFIGYQAGTSNTTGSQNSYLGYYAGGAMTTGSANTIVGRFTGNQGGLDIRTANNYIVLSDGDGNPRLISDNNGNWGSGTVPSSSYGFYVKGASAGGFLHYQNAQFIWATIALGTPTSGFSTANSCEWVSKDSSTSRSINAAGTVNTNGSDYAEYMVKAGSFTIAKGDVVGINAEGKLTNVFADAVSFVVKSTDPSFVGGDNWFTEEPPKDEDGTILIEGQEWDAYKERENVARQLVDRIAFSGQVPVNVTGATAGQYIIPVDDNGAIKGEAVINPTFEQYQQAVGKVIAIEQDGRARIIVKVA